MGSKPNDDDQTAQPLLGGRHTAGVVKVRETVRRPRTANSIFVERLLKHLEARQFDRAPRYLGVDDADRDILTYIPGEVPFDLGLFSESQLTQAARLLRSFHDATADFKDKGTAEVVCHGDASPCNCVFSGGLPFALIDFDDAYPGRRIDDLGYAAWLWLDIGSEDIAGDIQHERLQRFVAEYGVSADCKPGELVRMAQARHVSNSNLADHVREWSQACLEWTTRQGWE